MAILLMDIETERKFASDELEGFRVRYSKLGDDYLPLQIAVRWQRALQVEPVDFCALQEIYNDVKDRRRDFDIVFFMFCNHMESTLRETWHDAFRLRDNQ